jgi:hypothetical protein
MMDNSFYLAITFLSSHHKHLLLIISVSSTNSSSSSDVTTDSNPDDSPVTNKTPNPTVEEVKEWDKDQLLNWIQEFRPKLLTDDDDVEKFKAAKISGKIFLKKAGDAQFFEDKCHLPPGPSEELADLVSEICGGVTQGKLLSFIPYSKH